MNTFKVFFCLGLRQGHSPDHPVLFNLRRILFKSVSSCGASEFILLANPQNETLGASLDRLAYEIFYDEEVEKRYEVFVRQELSTGGPI